MKKTILAAGLALVAAGLGLNNANAEEQKTNVEGQAVSKFVIVDYLGLGLNLDGGYGIKVPRFVGVPDTYGYGYSAGIAVNSNTLFGRNTGTKEHSNFYGLVLYGDIRLGLSHLGSSAGLGFGLGTRKNEALKQFSIGGAFSTDIYNYSEYVPERPVPRQYLFTPLADRFRPRIAGNVLLSGSVFIRYDQRTISEGSQWGWYTAVNGKFGTGYGINLQVGFTWGRAGRYGFKK